MQTAQIIYNHYMIKYYYFTSHQKLDKSSFDDIIRKSYSQYLEIEYFDNFSGVILADENFFVRLNSIIEILNFDLGTNLIFLETYKLGSLGEKTILKLAQDKKYGVFAVSLVILQYSLSKDLVLYQELKKEFQSISKELLNTAVAYINCNMNACLASKSLYIHRNTFNYRLNKFIEQTQLDIRNYNNSILLLTYFLIESNL